MKIRNKCLSCEFGEYTETVEEYVVPLKDGATLTIPNITLWRCNCCFDEVIPAESSRKIDQYIPSSRYKKT